MVTPLKLGLINTVLYVGAAVFLQPYAGLAALPLAFALAQVFGGATYAFALARQLNIPFVQVFETELIRVLVAGLVMASVIGGGAVLLDALGAEHSTLAVLVLWGALTLGGGFVFLLVAYLLRVSDARLLYEMARRRLQRSGSESA
jgi:peptidoglycan biosynthesis protein MviN/MurJ (putative lipid II flippase)